MKKEIIQESGELIFLKYAFQVIGYCGRTRNISCNKSEVSEQEYKEFENMLKFGGTPDKKRLKYLFPDAVKSLKSWSQEDVMYYWLIDHNNIVKDNPLCKVYGGKVKEVLSPSNGEICRAKVGKNSGMETKSYISLEKGDLVSLHHFQVAQKFSQEDFNKYFRQ